MPPKQTQLIVLAAGAVSLALWGYGEYSKSRKKKSILSKSLSKAAFEDPSIFHHAPAPPNQNDDDLADFLEGDTVILDDAGVLA